MILRSGLALSLVVLTAPIAMAAPPDPGPLAVAVIETAILPCYRALTESTGEQAQAWRRACSDDTMEADAPALREAFQTASDAWSAVEYVTMGPVSLSLRPDRIFFAPDRRNYVSKALADLAAKARDGDLSGETMRGVSVAGQGFPALERVLYEPGESDAAVRCRMGGAIAGNLSSIASEISAAWNADDGPLARLKRGEGDPVHFADPAQAAARLMTDLAGGLQRVSDLELLPVLGSAADAAKPKAAEGWRSGRSARAVKATVASLGEMAKAFASAAPADVAAADAKAFGAARAAVAELPDDVGKAAADPNRRKPLEAAVAALKSAQRDVAKTLAPALGLPLGFNALDGD